MSPQEGSQLPEYVSTSPVPVRIRPQVDPGQLTYFQKGWEKCKQQPFVPIGILATCVAFGGATFHLRSGNRQSFNRFLRFRVIAQGVTIAACVIGSYLYGQEAIREKEKKRALEIESIKVAGNSWQSAPNPGRASGPLPTSTSQPPLKGGPTGDRVLDQLGLPPKRSS